MRSDTFIWDRSKTFLVRSITWPKESRREVPNVAYVMRKRQYNLFFECPIARLVWSTVCITIDIKKPTSINHILGMD
jgi:hypothetical protein